MYRVKFQNAYTSFTPPGGATIYYLNPDSVTIGTELETNVAITRELSAYANGTFGKAQYLGSGVPGGLWIANTPRYTQGTGLTYRGRNLDLGIFQKLIGPMGNDNKSYHDQVPIAVFGFMLATPKFQHDLEASRLEIHKKNSFGSR